jgi:pyruvate formate lyase activating enzyme
MLFGGIIKTTLIDYPGKIACTLFTVGCNLRCYYCHNPELVLEDHYIKENFFNENEVFKFLEKRKGLIDGICITGGEPTMQKDLKGFIKKVKEMGFLIKLDTNGSNYRVVKNSIDNKLVDYIAMDIKAPFFLEDYQRVCKSVDKEMFDNIKKTADLLLKSEIDYEFRTTVLPKIVSKKDIKNILEYIKGAKAYSIQNFIPADKLISPKLKKEKGYSRQGLNELLELAKEFVKNCEIR